MTVHCIITSIGFNKKSTYNYKCFLCVPVCRSARECIIEPIVTTIIEFQLKSLQFLTIIFSKAGIRREVGFELLKGEEKIERN